MEVKPATRWDKMGSGVQLGMCLSHKCIRLPAMARGWARSTHSAQRSDHWKSLGCYGLKVCVRPNLSVEALPPPLRPNVMASGNEASEK